MTWVTVLSALLTPTIAAFAIVIAFMQWRTAHQKVVLDLFDRRLKVYSAFEQACAEFEISRGGSVTALSNARDAFLESKFLFGTDVFNRVHRLNLAMQRFEVIPAEVVLYDSEKERRSAMHQANDAAMAEVSSFRNDMPNIFERYLRMEQKLVRTPFQWFHDRNVERLSYADDKQK